MWIVHSHPGRTFCPSGVPLDKNLFYVRQIKAVKNLLLHRLHVAGGVKYSGGRSKVE